MHISVTVVEIGGVIENLSPMRLGLLHVAESNPASAYAAYQGLLDFKDQRNPNIRMLLVTYIAPFTFRKEINESHSIGGKIIHPMA